ncbi:MAG: acetoacetate decarboxylase family protein [Actinomycetota bacterium]
MPVDRTKDISAELESAPLVEPATEPVVLPKAEFFQVMFEIESKHVASMLPPALHPTDPPTMTFTAIRAVDSPFGTFTVIRTRIGCRAGVRPRGYVVGGYIDNPDAGHEIAEKWAFPKKAAKTSLRKGYHAIVAEVVLDGRTILTTSLVDPKPLAGSEIQFAANMHLARVRRNGSTVPRLVQVDPELTIHRASSGRPRVDAFEAEAWGDARIKPVYPVSAWHMVADIELPRIRYLCDPNVTALQGTEKIG